MTVLILRFFAYALAYRYVVILLMMFLWLLMILKKSAVTRRLWFRICPIVFAISIVAQELYAPIAIISPADRTVVHPGDRVKLTVVLSPAFLSRLYPFVSLRLYRCYSCADRPPGIGTEGALTGSPYSFTIDVPANQPAGEIFVDAYASPEMGDPAAIRSAAIGLAVK